MLNYLYRQFFKTHFECVHEIILKTNYVKHNFTSVDLSHFFV